MALKFKYVDLTTGTSHNGAGAVSGEARGRIGLGAVYGRVLGFEFKGADANVDTNNTLELLDADGRTVLTATALDAGGTTTDQYTSQVAIIGGLTSTVGVAKQIVGLEAEALGQDGVATTDNVGAGGPVFAKSPLVVTIAAGTNGDVQRVGVWVEV